MGALMVPPEYDTHCICQWLSASQWLHHTGTDVLPTLSVRVCLQESLSAFQWHLDADC